MRLPHPTLWFLCFHALALTSYGILFQHLPTTNLIFLGVLSVFGIFLPIVNVRIPMKSPILLDMGVGVWAVALLFLNLVNYQQLEQKAGLHILLLLVLQAVLISRKVGIINLFAQILVITIIVSSGQRVWMIASFLILLFAIWQVKTTKKVWIAIGVAVLGLSIILLAQLARTPNVEKEFVRNPTELIEEQFHQLVDRAAYPILAQNWVSDKVDHYDLKDIVIPRILNEKKKVFEPGRVVWQATSPRRYFEKPRSIPMSWIGQVELISGYDGFLWSTVLIFSISTFVNLTYRVLGQEIPFLVYFGLIFFIFREEHLIFLFNNFIKWMPILFAVSLFQFRKGYLVR